MGIRFKEPSDAAASASAAAASPALREALLFITMSIIGLPVEVHIKDGSVYSGIFHTASVEMGYGVVLKKARMIKKGTHAAKGINRSLIDTLVVLPENLVQVSVKNVMVSANGVSGAVALDEVGAVASDVKPFEGSENVANHAHSQLDEDAKNRQDGVHRAKEEGACDDKPSFHKEEQVHKVQASSASSAGPHLQVKAGTENKKAMSEQQPDGTTGKNASQDTPDSRQSQRASGSVNTAASSTPDRVCFSSGATTRVIPVTSSVANRNARESKLNPGAKIFSPSFANVRPVTAPPPVLPTGANVAYVPNYYHAVPLVSPQSEPGIRSYAPCPSLPMKFVTYGNLATTNNGGLQYSQPIAGAIPNRSQPIRYNSQYQPGPPYVQQFPQNGLVGGTGQLVYLNPAAHELRPGAPPFSHAPHPQLTSHTIHIPKHEGVFTAPPQLSVTPPLMANEQLPFGVPSHIPLPQPTFPAIRHVPVLGAGGAYGAKFL